mgnify:CR=1 FL=1
MQKHFLFVFSLLLSVLLLVSCEKPSPQSPHALVSPTDPAKSLDSNGDIVGKCDNPASSGITAVPQMSRLRPESISSIMSHLGPGSIDIIPGSPTYVSNCIPFGNNTWYGFTGFIYRNVPAFNLTPGSKFAFDLGNLNDVDIRRNIYFAVANINPGPAVVSGNNVVSQGVKSLGWTKVVSDTQIPQNPKGNTIMGDYELIYTSEASFSFPGGGLIVGFGSSPPGAYADYGCEQVLVRTTSGDASGHFYSRFFSKPDQTLAVLDDITGGGSAVELGGIVIGPSNNPPVANAGPDQTVECAGASTSVTLDGSGSSDPDVDALTYTWTGSFGSATGVNPTVSLPLGTHTITLTVDDGKGGTDTDNVVVTIVDTAPPTVSCSVASSSLWPLNHNLVNVGLSASVSDACDPNPVVAVTVYGDEDDEEATGDGNHSPDAKDIALGTLRLRSERKGDADGRVYLIVVTATDKSGNVGFCSSTVVVPHSQSAAAIANVNAQAAAAIVSSSVTGSPVTPFVIGDGPTIGPKQ